MTITLPQDLQELVEREVAEGRFPSADKLVEDAVRAQLEELTAFRKSLDDAEAEAERDGWLSLDDLRTAIASRRNK